MDKEKGGKLKKFYVFKKYCFHERYITYKKFRTLKFRTFNFQKLYLILDNFFIKKSHKVNLRLQKTN